MSLVSIKTFQHVILILPYAEQKCVNIQKKTGRWKVLSGYTLQFGTLTPSIHDIIQEEQGGDDGGETEIKC